MDRRAAGALLALAACFACSAAAPTASNQTALDLYEGAPEGCYYNFQHYGEGDRIMTNEPCLNCTCHNRMLMCYLRVCPFTKAIGQDCTVEKRADQCCPIVTCPDVPVDLLTSTSTTSPAEYGATGLGKLDKYGCSINGKYFPEGSKVPPTPNKPCEHCYCIRNMTTCVMQECTLHVDGCTPIYHKDVCCPVRYSCDHPEDEVPLLDDMSTTVRPTPGFLLTTTTISPVTQMTQDCVHDDRVFSDGALIKTEKACEHCYCMKGDIVCVVQECGAPMENEGKNCTSLPPREGQCCPDTYICEGDELTSDLPTDSTESMIEKLTTLSPPRRTSVEGSGYRNEPDEAPYTDMPIIEPEVEGSGDEEESAQPLGPNEIIPTPGDDDQYIYVTTKGPAYEEHEKSTVAIDRDIIPDIKDKTVEPFVSTIAPTSDVEEKLTTSVEKDIIEPHEHVPTTRAPEIYESATTELGDSQNTVPDVIPDEEVAKPNEYTTGTTIAPSSESESLTPIEGEDNKLTSAQEGHDIIMSATSKPEYSTASSSTLDEIEKEMASPTDISNITPEVVTEKEYFDGDITRTTSATSVEESPAEQDKETSKPEILAPSTTISPAEGDKESSKPEELAPGTTSNPAEEEKESLEHEQLTPITTSSPLEEGEKLTTEPDHALNTVAISEEDNTHPLSHTPTTSVLLTVDEENTTVFNQEQDIVTEKVIKEDIPAPIDHVTTAASAEKETEFTTEEPDRGLNTIPSEIYEESSSDPPIPVRTTLSEEAKGTEPAVITDELQTQGVEIKSTTISELTTPQPEIIVTKGDQFTVTTEPSFRKEDESIISTEKPKEIEPTTVKSEFVDEGLIPTSPHEDKIGASSDVPTAEEEFTTSIPEYIKEIAETIGSKLTTTETNKETSVVTEISPEIVSEPSSEQDGDLSSSTEKLSEITPLLEAHEEPSRIPGEGDCLLNGVTYRNNTVVPSTNNCHTGCRCASSIIKCDPIICSPPPDYMENCQSIYDSPDSCCPTFVCDHPRETAPPQSDNQMSGTESPMPSPTIECRGDQCEISEPTKQPSGPSEPCTSGNCLTADEHKIETECGPDGCSDLSQKPETSIPSVEHTEECSGGKCKPESCANGKCQAPQTQVSPVTPCEGEHCEKTDQVEPELPQQCKNGEDCKISEIPTSETIPCEGDSCNKIDCGVGGCGSDIIASSPDQQLESCKEEDGCKPQDIPTPECTGDEPCRRKETSTSDAKPPATCEGSSCVSEKETTVAHGVINLSTELPKTEQTPSQDATEKILPAEEEKVTEPDEHISKPDHKDTQDIDSYTTEGPTAEGDTSTDIHKEQPISGDETTKKITTAVEKETEMPVIMEEKDKDKPISEEQITLKPTMIEKEGSEIPDVIEEETTAPAVLGEKGKEKPTVDEEKVTEETIIVDDKSTDEPTLVGDEGKEKPDISEKESTELPIIDSEEDIKKPAIDDKEKPIIHEESTSEPTITDEDDKQKPVIDEETTKEPAFIHDDDKQKPVDEESTKQPEIVDGDDKEKPVVVEESTNEPTTTDEDDKEKPMIDEESTKHPATVDEGDKEKPTIDEESTKQPATVDEGDKEIPTIEEESTKQPATVDEGDKEKPVVDEESTKKPDTVEVEGTTRSVNSEDEVTTVPSTGEKATDAPTIIDQTSTDVPAVAGIVTEKPSFIDEGSQDKLVETEKDKTDKLTITEDDTKKPMTVDEAEKPTDAHVKETDKPGQEHIEEIGSEKPDLTEREGTDKPAVEETTANAVVTDEDGKEKPDHGENEVTEKPIDVDENGTETPVIIEEKGTEKPIAEDDDKKPVFEQGDTEKPTNLDKESTEKPLVEDDGKTEPAVFEHESTEKSVTSDVPKTEKSPEIEEEYKDKPHVFEGSTAEPDIVDEDKSSEKPDINRTEEPIVIDKDTEKPALVNADDKEIPAVVEMESTEKPSDIEKEVTELPINVGEETTKKPVTIDEEGIKKPDTEEDTMKPFIIEEESTAIPDITVEEGTAKPVIIDESTEEPTIIEKEDPMKPAVIEREGTELPAIDGEEGTEKPSVSDEETKEKHDLADQEGTKKPAIVQEGTEEPVVPEDGTEEPSIFEREGTEKPTLIDEDGKVKPIAEDDSKKPILVGDKDQEKPIVNEDGDKPLIIDEEVTDKPAVNEVVSTERPKVNKEEGSGSELPETSHTTEPEKDVKSPEITVQPTEATITEIDKTSKTPYFESQTTVSQDDVTSPQETSEIKVTEAENSFSKEPVVEDHSRTPEITTESLSTQEITTKTPVADHEKVTIPEQDIEGTTLKVDTTVVKEEGSSGGQDLISEEPELITKVPEIHKTSESVEPTTEKGLISEQEEVSTDTSEIESPTTKAPAADLGNIEPQEGIEPDKPDLHVTSKLEEESTTKVYEEDKIKPVPESHETEASATSSKSDGVTDVPEITDEHKPKPELQTYHPVIHSSEKEEILTETPEYSVTEPITRFTEIEDPSVTGQEDIATGYSEETTEHHLSSEKVDESDVGIASSEKPILTDMESELPEKSTESDKPVTKMPDHQTQEAEKEKTTDKLESPATEIAISDVTESQPISDIFEKDVTKYDEKATTASDFSEDKNIGTTLPTINTEKQEPGIEITQHHITTTEDVNKATGPYVIEPQVTESQETSTKSVEQEKEGEAETTAPEQMYTESYDVDKKEPSVTETQKVSTDLSIQDAQTEIPDVQVSSEVPQSLVTEQKDSLGEQTTVSSIPKEESSYKPELPTTQSEEISEAPEKHGPEEIPTEAPVHVTEPVEISTKEPDQEDKITHVSEVVTEKQYTATTLRETPAVAVEVEHSEIIKSTEHTSTQTEVSETTPYLIELEEHTHKIAKDPTTVSPSEEEHSYKPVEDTSTSSPPEEELSQKPVEDISTSSPSEEEHSQKPVEDISTSYPSEAEHSYKPIDDISTSSPTEGEDLHKPVEDLSTSAPFEEEHSHKPVEDISTSSPSAEEYTPKIEEYITTVSPLDEKLTTVEPAAGEELQVSELTTQKADEEIETATKEAEGITKPSEESLPEDVSQKISESIPVEETTPAVIHGEDDKDAADHKENTTAAPSQITEASTPVIVTESEESPASESDIAVPTEKEVTTSEKPSHPIVSHETTVPEEEFIFSTTKATTILQGEDIAAPGPDDKLTKPEEKPSETNEVPPLSTTAEVSKPSTPDLQPTDEIPVPDDDGHFPPSGTSGYGEPDYVEEDQAFGPGTCRYGGKVYVSAQQIPRDDPCDFCFCFRSDIICLQQSCPPPIHGCHEEPIQGFCCPRYECPVSMATTVNITTTTTTTTTTVPPNFPTHSYKGQAQRRGCQIKGHTYKVGEVVRSSSGPCLHCTCGGDGQMKCDPKACTPEPMLRQMIAAAVSAKRRR